MGNRTLQQLGPSRGLAGYDARSSVIQVDGTTHRVVGFDPARRSLLFGNPDGLAAIFVGFTSAVAAGSGFVVPPHGVILFSNPPFRILPELEWFGVTAGGSINLIIGEEYELSARTLYQAYAQAGGGLALGRYSRNAGGWGSVPSVSIKPA